MIPHPIDHIAIAVKDLDKEITRYTDLWGATLEFREAVASQKTEVAFIQTPNTRIELLTPLDSTSAVTKFLEKRGEGLHHICYKVPDIKAELTRLASLGCILIDKEPRIGAGGHLIAFIHPKSMGGVLVELCE